MTSMSTKAGTGTSARRSRTSARLRTGLAISVLVGVASAIPSGGDGPPFAIEVLSTILGIVLIGSAVAAWRSGHRLAIRINAAALLLNALTALPVFFVHVVAGVKVGSAVLIVLTVAALMLTMRPEQQSFTATD
jgi:peptidoglycan/LPS O-acetylase OafA/YrhL